MSLVSTESLEILTEVAHKRLPLTKVHQGQPRKAGWRQPRHTSSPCKSLSEEQPNQWGALESKAGPTWMGQVRPSSAMGPGPPGKLRFVLFTDRS